MDAQPVDLELLDPEVSDNRSPDRKPANGQGAEGTGTNGRCADHGRAKASRSKLHRGRLLPARTASGKGPRERSTVVHECSSSAQQEPRRRVGCQSLVLDYRRWLARMSRLAPWSSSGGHPIAGAGPGEHHSIEVSAGPGHGEAHPRGIPRKSRRTCVLTAPVLRSSSTASCSGDRPNYSFLATRA
jgi:hypothetical protein